MAFKMFQNSYDCIFSQGWNPPQKLGGKLGGNGEKMTKKYKGK